MTRGDGTRDAGWAAPELARRIRRVPGLCPEQIASPPDADTPAVLIDQWGRRHPLRAATVIGREPADADIAVLQSSVSRRHAELRYDAAADAWTVRDLGSTNGTFVEGRRCEGQVPIGDLQLVAVGDVAFAFLSDGASLAARSVTESIRSTAASPVGGGADALRLVEPTAGGAGIAEYRGRSVQLGAAQFALVQLLAERYLAEQDQPAEVRGFVRSVELLADLPWDTPHPDDNHLKQLVRRVRRAFERAGLPDAIESRHRFGYRLVIPPIPAPPASR